MYVLLCVYVCMNNMVHAHGDFCEAMNARVRGGVLMNKA